MSIMCCDENMIILSHEKYLAETYSTASKDKIWLLFDICSPFRMDGEAAAIAKRKYSVILLDPPWENKHVKRAKGSGTEYHMMDNQQIQEIPVSKLLNAEGLVLIWCSNNTRHRKAIASWLRTWNLKQIAKWYWLKVTKYGELICDFSAHKNPYEVLIIATTNNCDKWNDVPDNKVVVSVPSGIHSHKPPLEAVINNSFPGISSSSRLELFARYLQPSWVSVGNEASKLNHSILLS